MAEKKTMKGHNEFFYAYILETAKLGFGRKKEEFC